MSGRPERDIVYDMFHNMPGAHSLPWRQMSDRPTRLAVPGTASVTRALRDVRGVLDLPVSAGDSSPPPAPLDFDQVLDELRSVMTVAEIAEVTGVRERQVHHWVSGTHSPQSASRDRLLAVHRLVAHLLVALNPEATKIWLWSPNPTLDNQRPFDCLAAGESRSVLAAGKELWLQHQPDDLTLVAMAKEGRSDAYDQIIRRYRNFVNLKASSYFLLYGDADGLIQEGLLGLFKAVRDFRTDRESSFRNFAELCITRQIITAVKTATRHQHTALNQYASFDQAPAGGGDGDTPLHEILPGSSSNDPANHVIATGELNDLIASLGAVLSDLELRVLSLYLDGHSYEAITEQAECDAKAVDKALQRVKRKIGTHLEAGWTER